MTDQRCYCRSLDPADTAAVVRLTFESAQPGERVCKFCLAVLYSAAWKSPLPAVALRP